MTSNCPEAFDFHEECESIANLLDDRPESDFETSTLFKNWTVNDIIGHLHIWNIAANLTLTAPDSFVDFLTQAVEMLGSGHTHPQFQEKYFKGKSGLELYTDWKNYYPDMSARFAASAPEDRVKWAGPDMSVRSCIIARQMEHWAHAQAIFDVFGQDRSNSKRLKNVAHIGVMTYSWSFKIKGLWPLLPKPYVYLTAPNGDIWEWNTPQKDNRVDGSAEEFCQVVTQCRNIGDTALKTTGDAAKMWMQIAQCFAGGSETPPAKGTRRKALI